MEELNASKPLQNNSPPELERLSGVNIEASSSKEEDKALRSEAANRLIEKVKSLDKRIKIVVVAISVLVVAIVIWNLLTQPPFRGDWYNDEADSPIITFNPGGTAVIHTNDKANVEWKQDGNSGLVQITITYFDSGGYHTSTSVFQYGKDSFGDEYLVSVDEPDKSFFRSYAQARKMMSDTR